MKKLILSAVLLISSNAFATHAYRSEDCVSTTHNLSYLGNYPFGGFYGMHMSHQTTEDNIYALPLFDGEQKTTLEEAPVIFNQTDYKITEDSGERAECYFDHRDWSSEQTIEISLITEEAGKALGLKVGDKLTFICKESTDFPNGNNCDESEEQK